MMYTNYPLYASPFPYSFRRKYNRPNHWKNESFSQNQSHFQSYPQIQSQYHSQTQSNNKNGNQSQQQTSPRKLLEETKKQQSKNYSSENRSKNSTEIKSFLNLPTDEPLFEIFGIKLYFDDILLLCLIFFLYKEGVQDQYLFIALILLLLS